MTTYTADTVSLEDVISGRVSGTQRERAPSVSTAGVVVDVPSSSTSTGRARGHSSTQSAYSHIAEPLPDAANYSSSGTHRPKVCCRALFRTRAPEAICLVWRARSPCTLSFTGPR